MEHHAPAALIDEFACSSSSPRSNSCGICGPICAANPRDMSTSREERRPCIAQHSSNELCQIPSVTGHDQPRPSIEQPGQLHEAAYNGRLTR